MAWTSSFFYNVSIFFPTTSAAAAVAATLPKVPAIEKAFKNVFGNETKAELFG